jgi:succinate dehydrogenase / fumarate reductase flavoprotein subunit
VLPSTISDYLAGAPFPKVDPSHPAVVEAVTAVKNRIALPCPWHPDGRFVPS